MKILLFEHIFYVEQSYIKLKIENTNASGILLSFYYIDGKIM